jgi:hypothetical protein
MLQYYPLIYAYAYFPLDYPIKIVYAVLVAFVHAACLARLILFNLVALIILGKYSD